MRYTRLEPIKKAAYSRIRILIGFIVVIPVVSIIIGSIITKIAIIPLAQKNGTITNLNKSREASVTLKNNIFSVYILQAGAFSNSNNADMLKNAIISTGEKACVADDNKIYRVIVDIDEKKDSIIKTKDKLSKNGYVCLINEIKIGAESKDKKFTKYINTVDSVVYEQIMIEKKSSKADIKNLKKGVEEVKNNFTLIKDSDIYLKKGKEIDDFNKVLLELVNEYIKEYDTKGENGFKYIADELIIIKNFFNLVNEFEMNNNI